MSYFGRTFVAIIERTISYQRTNTNLTLTRYSLKSHFASELALTVC